ncbi:MULTISPECIES: response regulator transcription factor [Pseudomonas]|uniref:Putative Virulence factors positive transcription regulator BvgA n=1 Tax=Pseudomonas marincola TaxID=437900 RepID=A0A1I7E6L7_9PSED|nr:MULTISPECIES: response regulator transcription factor [Pseudomonas]MAB97098.1 DNA-binding response regulator [Pseudomonadaceae bacterium]MBQ57187.1 DNA-binding response regulator [Pseudomonadaceae bacterium]OEO23410.1 DNA-binding response regulator [Pseudomonas sp. J237]CAE6889818.1 putative Virulence factors positive transcription regulator BvgA [Pseudomonas marincola]SFU19591.1 two-component system, NarL family, response regulator EvgA [Pseudomonas marincola]
MGKVLIVDDHPVVRMAVRMLLEKHGLSVTGETDNGVDAVQMAKELRPDIIILDISIPRLDGFEVISRLKLSGLPIHILVLTSQSANFFSARCMQAGASGFVCKEEKLAELLNAVKAIQAGYTYFPAQFIKSVRGKEVHMDEHERITRLSDRELMVLEQLARGLTNKQIAESMLLSNKTISTYKTRLHEKLNTGNLVELIELAKRNALV